MVSIELDEAALAQLAALPARIEDGIEDGLQQVEKRLEDVAQREAAKIDQRPVPRRAKSGLPAWERTGQLKQSLQAALPKRDEVTLGGVDYAEPRNALGNPRQPKQPAGGVVRRNPFLDDTHEIIETEAPGIIEAAIERAVQ